MNEQYNLYKALIEEFLSNLFGDNGERLTEAMRYSLMSGGKRIRPVITLAFCEMCGSKPEKALPAACAIELIHTYSLIHDDLPCMDNDDSRRGKPTNHKVYGEAMALLAGDGLLSHAFQLVRLNPDAAADIALAAFNMVRGQALEIDGCDNSDYVNMLKTGELFVAAARSGCLVAGADDDKLHAATEYADALGLAFQYKDDMLDSETDCQTRVEQLTSKAKNAVSAFENSTFLCDFADWLCNRNY